ncbi:MAG: hypothetical protein HC915_12420 [Anaerolineae bacterium]|nr:hypothetical protein [Anaerolineae bacterium]
MELIPLIALAGTALHLGLLFWLQVRVRAEQLAPRLRRWLGVTLLAAALTNLAFLLPRGESVVEALGTDALKVLGASLTLALLSGLTYVFLQRRGSGTLIILSLGWLAVLAVATSQADQTLLGTDGWLGESVSDPYAPGLLTVAGWLALALAGLAPPFLVLYGARLPEVANRTVLWLIVIPFPLMGSILAGSGSSGLVELGLLGLGAGLAATVFAVVRLQAVDMRRGLLLAFASATLTMLTAMVFFG